MLFRSKRDVRKRSKNDTGREIFAYREGAAYTQKTAEIFEKSSPFEKTTLTAVSTLLAQCSKVGGNLNQLARHFNSGGADTEQIRAKLLDELADLTAFRLHAEKVLGELYGNAQAYRL